MQRRQRKMAAYNCSDKSTQVYSPELDSCEIERISSWCSEFALARAIHIDARYDKCVIRLQEVNKRRRPNHKRKNILGSILGKTQARYIRHSRSATPQPTVRNYVVNLALMEKHIDMLAAADKSASDVISARDLYVKSNPGLCGGVVDITNPRAWYDSSQTRKLMKNFDHSYANQVEASTYNSTVPQAKFIVDLPQSQNGSVNVTNYVETIRYCGQLDAPDNIEVASLFNGVITSNDIETTKRISEHPINDQGDSKESLTKNADPRSSYGCVVGDGKDLPLIKEVSHPLVKAFSRNFCHPVPVIKFPTITDRNRKEQTLVDSQVNDKLEEKSKNDVTEDSEETLRELRLPQSQSKIREDQRFKEVYVLRQKSLLKLKTQYCDDFILKRNNPGIKNIVKRDTKFSRSLPGNERPTSSELSNPLEDNLLDSIKLKTNEKLQVSSVEKENHQTEMGVDKDKQKKFIYKSASDDFISRSNGINRTNPRTSVINLNLNGVNQTKPSPTRVNVTTSKSYDSLPLSQFALNGQVKQQTDTNYPDKGRSSSVKNKLTKTSLQTFKRLEVFSEMKRPSVSKKGFHLRQNHVMDTRESQKEGQAWRLPASHGHRVTTHNNGYGKTTILIDTNTDSGRSKATPLRIEVTFSRGCDKADDSFAAECKQVKLKPNDETVSNEVNAVDKKGENQHCDEPGDRLEDDTNKRIEDLALILAEEILHSAISELSNSIS